MIRLLLAAGVELAELLKVALGSELCEVRRIHGGDAALRLGFSHDGRWRRGERATRYKILWVTSGRGQLGELKASLLLDAGREQSS